LGLKKQGDKGGFGPTHEVDVHGRWIKVVVFALGQRSIVIKSGMYW
jgi:hypothetical protein